MKELWREISDDPSYLVSNLGRVKSKGRYVNTIHGGKRFSKGQILKPFFSKSTGYLQVNLSMRHRVSVHRIVAEAFCSGMAPGLVVNHINGVRDDNRAENLEWATYSWNQKHRYEVLGQAGSCTDKFSGEHPTSKAVISTCLVSGKSVRYEAAMDAVREGFDSSSISRCCNGEYRSHKGRAWRFADDQG
ncbi:TPA: NUMOD4 motif-containing HNH endonuclease [Aeromonas hydrophila]|nr:NUMOD4 motif-containing HNH endonuclease [Aeromonas hydrophila]HEH9410301.1 NUMOD4 motif-containing HNH endonuclease [Aeromonas salmonicida]